MPDIALPTIVPVGKTAGYHSPPATTPQGLGMVGWGRTALGAPDDRYRLWLWRGWGQGPAIHWVMLNPSTADALLVDPTIRRVLAFSALWGYGQCYVTNIWTVRATDPKALYQQAAPEYHDLQSYAALQLRSNDRTIRDLHRLCDATIVAWGNHGLLHGRGKRVLHMIGNDRQKLLQHLGYTKEGQPRHPLYVKRDSPRFYLSEGIPTGMTWP